MMMIFAFEQSLDYCGLSWDLSAGFLQPLSDQTSRLPSTIRPNLQAPTTIIWPPCRLPSTIQPDLPWDLPADFPLLSNQTYLETSLQASLYYPTKPSLSNSSIVSKNTELGFKSGIFCIFHSSAQWENKQNTFVFLSWKAMNFLFDKSTKNI